MRIKNKLSMAVVFASLMGVNAVASAAFNIYADPDVVSQKVKKQDSYSFKQIGSSMEKSRIVKDGYAPLQIATKHLIPKGWDVRVAEGANLENEIVKWRGNVTWPHALESMALNNNMDIVVNWERRYVTFDSRSKRNDFKNSQSLRLASASPVELSTDGTGKVITSLETPAPPTLIRNSNDDGRVIMFGSNQDIIDTKPNTNLDGGRVIAINQVNNEDEEIMTTNQAQSSSVDSDSKLNKVIFVDNGDNAQGEESGRSLDLNDTNKKEDEVFERESYLSKLSDIEKHKLEQEYKSSNLYPVKDGLEEYAMLKEKGAHEYMQLKYILRQGKTLQENIREWAAQMPLKDGLPWTVEWSAKKDFLVIKDVTFISTFIDVFGDVELIYERSDHPLKFDLYIKNNIIHVYDKNFVLNHIGVNGAKK